MGSPDRTGHHLSVGAEALDDLAQAGSIDKRFEARLSRQQILTVALFSYQQWNLTVVRAISWQYLSQFEHYAQAIYDANCGQKQQIEGI